MSQHRSMKIAILGCLLASTTASYAESKHDLQAANAFTSPATVYHQLIVDQKDRSLKDWYDWKDDLEDRTGLSFGIDYNTAGYAATNSLGDDISASGVFRLYGRWNFIGRGTNDTGGIVFKFENRHSYTDVSPKDLGFKLGYAGLNNTVFNGQGWRATHLFWRQGFNDGRGITYVGYLDITDYVDVYALASPWTSFTNLAFETGSGTIGNLPDGALGAMIGSFITNNIYIVAGIADANADATDIGSGIDTFFNDFETFKTVEFGWTSAEKNEPALFLKNIHVTFWQVDERIESGIPDGWGIAFSVSSIIEDRWLPFIRGGWAEDGDSLYEASLSIGLGYYIENSKDTLGVGLNLSRPNETTFQQKLDDQFTAEMFYNLHLSENLVITPNFQLLVNPALNPNDNVIGLFGIRARMDF